MRTCAKVAQWCLCAFRARRCRTPGTCPPRRARQRHIAVAVDGRHHSGRTCGIAAHQRVPANRRMLTPLSNLDPPAPPIHLPLSSAASSGPGVRLPDTVIQPSTGVVLVVSCDPTDL